MKWLIKNFTLDKTLPHRYSWEFALMPKMVFEKENEPHKCVIWLEPYIVRDTWNANQSWYENKVWIQKDGSLQSLKD